MPDPIYIPDHAARALARRAQQFKDKIRIEKVFNAWTKQIQEIEFMLWQLFSLRSIDTAVGVTLDVLGKIVGERRGGTSDANYRLRIRARIRANLSDGQVEDILSVFRTLISAASLPGVIFEWQDFYPAGFVFKIKNYLIPFSLLSVYKNFLKDSRGAGIEAQLGYQTIPDSEAFTFAVATFLTAPAMIGDTSIAVRTTTGMPFTATGDLILDEGTPDEETVTYTSRTATTFSGFTLASAHVVDTAVSLTPSPGKGWGDVLDATKGGAWVGITGA